MSLSGSVNVGATAGFSVGSFTENTGGVGRDSEEVEAAVAGEVAAVLEDGVGVGGISGGVASN